MTIIYSELLIMRMWSKASFQMNSYGLFCWVLTGLFYWVLADLKIFSRFPNSKGKRNYIHYMTSNNYSVCGGHFL